MYDDLKETLLHLTFDELEFLNQKNNLRINSSDLAIFHHSLTQQWDQMIDPRSLSLNDDYLKNYYDIYEISKYHELITMIKRNLIFNKL